MSEPAGDEGGRDRGRGSTASRRAVLAAGAGAVGALAGCTAGGTAADPVEFVAAGSLQRPLSEGLAPALDVPVRVDARGSAAAARLVADGVRDPDVVSLADPVLFETVLDPDWYVEFASNAVVLAYDPDTEGGRRVGAAGPDRWWAPLVAGEVRLGRTDPDHDPLGYRTLFALELAGEFYDDAPALRTVVPDERQVYPETSLTGRLETGAVEAAFVYRSMAVQRGYEFLELPAAVDLSDPEHAERYARARHELPDGTVVRGAPIAYAATARSDGERVRRVFREHVTGDYLAAAGFARPPAFPRGAGEVPDGYGV